MTRTPDGRFADGNPGGPGRPRRQIEGKYLGATIDSVSLDQWKRIVRKAVEDALNGDARARDWLSGYLLGRPRESVEINHIQDTRELEERFAHMSDDELRAILAEAEDAAQGER